MCGSKPGRSALFVVTTLLCAVAMACSSGTSTPTVVDGGMEASCGMGSDAAIPGDTPDAASPCGNLDGGNNMNPGDAATCGALNGSCTSQRTSGNPNCAEYSGFQGAQADALQSQCMSRGNNWSTSGCRTVNPGLTFGCRNALPGSTCTTNWVQYSDPAQMAAAATACMIAGGTIQQP